MVEHIQIVFWIILKTPNKTRWNCTYDALLQIKKLILDHDEIEKMNKSLNFCEIVRVFFQEITLFNEYCDVMEPLVNSLDFCKERQECLWDIYYKLFTFYKKKKINALKQKILINCGDLLKTI